MRTRLIVLATAGLLAAVVGAGLAASRGHDVPTHLPDPSAEELYVAGPDGEALKCNGKLVKVKRAALGGRIPPLTPEQAAQRSVLLEPRAKVVRCEKGPRGKETGRAVVVDAASPDAAVSDEP